MEENHTFINFDPNDFIIRITPVMENGEWSGEINVGQDQTSLLIVSNQYVDKRKAGETGAKFDVF